LENKWRKFFTGRMLFLSPYQQQLKALTSSFLDTLTQSRGKGAAQ